jgi:hypothetical protein
VSLLEGGAGPRKAWIIRLSRWGAAAATVGVLAAILAAAAPATPPAGPRAAQACARGHSQSADLNTADHRLLRRYVPCVLLELLGNRDSAISSSWDHLLSRIMMGFEDDPKRDYTSSFIDARLNHAAHPVLRRILPSRFNGCAKFSIQEGDTVPPPITLADIAAAVQRAVSVVPAAAAWESWGAYVGHRPLFHDGAERNISWAVSGVAGATGC